MPVLIPSKPEKSNFDYTEPDVKLLEPIFQPVYIAGNESTWVGYNFDDQSTSGGHFVQILSGSTEAERRSRMIRMACHVAVDATPDDGLGELLEKVVEIREYYTTLSNWTPASLPAAVPVHNVQVSRVYERESLSIQEE